MHDSTPTHCYLGTKACGFGFIAVDSPELGPEIGRDTDWMVRTGGKVERLLIQAGRDACGAMPAECDACRN